MLKRNDVILLAIDFQEKLLPKMHGGDEALACGVKLARFARVLDLPILWTEQYPKGIGPTVAPLREALAGTSPFEKLSFGCFGAPGFSERVAELGRRQILIAGIEAHVCVLQTALAGCDAGYEVYVVRDAVSSRNVLDCEAGLERMRHAGVTIVTTEMAMFEILGAAGTEDFKKVLPIIK